MSDSVFVNIAIDDFVTTRLGEPYRLLPLGRIVKNGRITEITKELLAKFKLPHFKPPIKLGSHNDETPAGGHIAALEVREDGLWAVPEYTETGTLSLARGDYRYHSPEIIWAGGFLENPTDGSLIEGPMIVGDAFLHTPHLGEATALYSIEEITHGGNSMSEMTQVPTPLWDRFMAWFDGGNEPKTVKAEPAQTPEPDNKTDEFAAKYELAIAEVDQYKAQIAKMEAEKEQAAKVSHFAAEFNETPLADDNDLHMLLAGVDDETAEKLVVKFRALAVQAKAANLTGDIGSHGDNGANYGVNKYQAAVDSRMKDAGEDRMAAAVWVAQNQPEYLEDK